MVAPEEEVPRRVRDGAQRGARVRKQCEQCGVKRDAQTGFPARGNVCVVCKKKNAKRAARARHLMKTYEITLEEYEEMAKSGCQICGGSRPYSLHVDHDHAIAEQFGMRASVRGVICKRENKILRDVRDDADLLDRIRKYVLRPPAKGVLFP